MTSDLLRLVNQLDDHEFEQLYGPLARLRPGEAVELLDGMEAPWWIVGGWAIEAFTGRSRPHEDLDLCVLASDVPRLLHHFLDSHHVWAAGEGALCPVLAADQRLPRWLNQFWIRETASGPWLLDVIVTPDRDGRWVFRRDPAYDDDLDAVTWTADDGLRYQNPEITLAFKAAHARPKDTADLQATLPRLPDPARRWLADTIAHLHPDHPWLQLIHGSPDGGS